jgi:hypothetical protein
LSGSNDDFVMAGVWPSCCHRAAARGEGAAGAKPEWPSAGDLRDDTGARERNMAAMKAIVGALTIMMASGAIADFDVTEADDEVYVQVWSADDERPRSHVHEQVALMLGPRIDEHRITVVRKSDS